MEKQIDTTRIYEGKVVRLRKDKVELEDGSYSYREVVEHNGGACIALKDNDGKYFMVKQYRYSQSVDMLEFPAGKLEVNENPYDAILRESIEETGYEAINVKEYGYIVPTCGYCEEKIYLYSGDSGTYFGQHFDEDEDLHLFKYSLEEIKDMITKGIINDAKTIALVYHLMSNSNDN